MTRKIVITMMLTACALMLKAQVGRTFVLKISDDGKAELHCSLPRYPNGRAVVACPGGAYGFLSFEKEGTDWAPWFNERGIAHFTLRYRLPNGNPEIPVGDAYAAMRLVRDSAEAWKINPYDVGIMGFSAGGHLAATVSTKAPWDARPNFSILMYPVITMSKRWGHPGSTERFLGEHQTDSTWQKQWSAEKHVDHYSTPPAIIMLSNDDRVVPPVTNGLAYYSAMRRAGNECAMHVYPYGDHGYGFASWFKYHDQMLGDLDRWLNDHKAPKKDAIRVACIGNSITRGSLINMASEHGYPAQLQKILGWGYNVHNFGAPGYTALRQGDNPYIEHPAWQMARDFQPNIIIVKLGTNDARGENRAHLGEFEQDLQLMVDTLVALPSKPRVILCTPTRVMKVFHGMDNKVIEKNVIPYIYKVAKRHKLEVIDMQQVITDEKLMFSDGVHPNHNGAKKLAEAVANAIKNETKK